MTKFDHKTSAHLIGALKCRQRNQIGLENDDLHDHASLVSAHNLSVKQILNEVDFHSKKSSMAGLECRKQILVIRIN